jgi:hypothetical protein
MVIVFVTVLGEVLSKNTRRFPDVSATIVSARQGRAKKAMTEQTNRISFFMGMSPAKS